jgi:hypothetical protein
MTFDPLNVGAYLTPNPQQGACLAGVAGLSMSLSVSTYWPCQVRQR